MDNYILITGASGNLGSIVLDRIPSSYKIVALVRDKPRIRVQKDTEFVGVDLLNRDSLFSQLKSIPNINVIIHIAGVTDSSPHPIFQDNVIMAKNIVSLAKKKHTQHIIFISSNSVNYSDRPYAISKKKAETIIINSQIPYTIIRPTMLINKNSVELKKIVSLVKSSPLIPLVNNGSHKIQPIYADDVSTAINVCINNKMTVNKIYTIGGKDIVPTKSLIHLACQLSNRRPLLLNIPQTIVLFILKMLDILKLTYLKNTLSPLIRDITVDNSIAINDLSWTPTSFDKIVNKILTTDSVHI